MLYYLNNWQNRDHATIYAGDAFYDLWADGVENERVRQMVTGDTCLVLIHSRTCTGTSVSYVWPHAGAARRG